MVSAPPISLSGAVITDPALAGPGGTAVAPSATGNVPNVDYLRAAMSQEIAHANLLRAVANLGADATTDPYQTFYFPAGTFDTLSAFIAMLGTLENAFIGSPTGPLFTQNINTGPMTTGTWVTSNHGNGFRRLVAVIGKGL